MKKWFCVSIITLGELVVISLLLTSCRQNKKQFSSQALQKEGELSYQWEITSLQTSWRKVSRGFTALDGMLWVPEIRVTVRNTGTRDIDFIYFKVIFLDDEGVIKGDDIIERVNSIPAGYARGPIFLYGSVGYTSDLAFLPMMKDNSKKWRFNLFVEKATAGPGH